MKKFTVLFLAGLLILALGVTASAQAPKLEFRASGMLDTQTFLGENVPQYMNAPQNNAAFWGSNPVMTSINGSMGFPAFYGTVNPAFALADPGGVFGGLGAGRSTYVYNGGVMFPRTSISAGFNKVDSHWEARAHLKFDAIMGPNLSGTIFFEMDTGRWGAQGNSGFPGLGREANNFGTWTTDRASVEIKNIYIDVGLPYFGIPVPMTVRVGAQPIGIRPHMVANHDGTGVTVGAKIDPVQINFIYGKLLEGNDWMDDDSELWGGSVSAKLGTFTVGGYGLFYRLNTYPIWVTAPVAGLPAGLNPVVAGTMESHMWWVGAYLDGKAGPLNVNFDYVWDFGSVQRTGVITALQRTGVNPFLLAAQPGSTGRQIIPPVKYQGWAVRTKIDYPVEKFNFGVVGMYATGPDTRSVSASGLPGDYTSINTFSRFNRGYVVPPGSEQSPANMESMVVYSMEGQATGGYGLAHRANYAGLGPGGFGGTWFAKLYASMKATPWWKITFQGLYVGDTTDGGNTLGSAWRFPYQRIFPISNRGVNMLRNDQKIGIELDLIQEFQIYNNLRFFLGFGYLFAGDATDVGRVGFDSGLNPIGLNRSIANPWALRTRLQYTF